MLSKIQVMSSDSRKAAFFSSQGVVYKPTRDYMFITRKAKLSLMGSMLFFILTPILKHGSWFRGLRCSLLLPMHCHLIDESEVAPTLAGQTYSWPCRYLKFNKCLALN